MAKQLKPDSETAVYDLRASARYAWLAGRNKRARDLNRLADQMDARLRKRR